MYKVNDVTNWLSQTTDNLKYFLWSPGLWDKESHLYNEKYCSIIQIYIFSISMHMQNLMKLPHINSQDIEHKQNFDIDQGWMDGWVRFLRPFNSISVISRWWKGEHERLCAMKHRLGSGRISPPAGFEPATPWSEVGIANHSATRSLQHRSRAITVLKL